MRNRLAILAMPLALALSAAPLGGQNRGSEISKMTCAELSKLDRAGRMQVADQHLMLSAYGKLAHADKISVERKLGIPAGITSAQKDEMILAAIKAGMKASTAERTAKQKATAAAAAERHLLNLDAACRGNDEMIVGKIIG